MCSAPGAAGNVDVAATAAQVKVLLLVIHHFLASSANLP